MYFFIYNHHTYPFSWCFPDPQGSGSYRREFQLVTGTQQPERSARVQCKSHWHTPFVTIEVKNMMKQQQFFPTCQVRVVRFYVSLFSRTPSPSPPPPPSSSSSCRDPVSSVWRAGPQPRSCECSVACRTPTAILRVQCGVPTPTEISWVQCCVPDLNCDPASSVWRAGPQLRSCEFSVACRTSSIVSENLSERMTEDMSKRMPEDMSERYVRKNVKRYVRKNVRRYVRKNVKRYVRKNVKRYVRKNVRR